MLERMEGSSFIEMANGEEGRRDICIEDGKVRQSVRRASGIGVGAAGFMKGNELVFVHFEHGAVEIVLAEAGIEQHSLEPAIAAAR